MSEEGLIRVILPNGVTHIFEHVTELSSSLALSILREKYPNCFETTEWTFASVGLRRSDTPDQLVPKYKNYDEEARQHWEHVDRLVNTGLGSWVFAWMSREETFKREREKK
jgi:hypothetical protein